MWRIGFGTILSLLVVVGLFRFKAALRQRLFSTSKGEEGSKAMTELLMLQARLEGRAVESSGGEVQEEDDGVGSGKDSGAGG